MNEIATIVYRLSEPITILSILAGLVCIGTILILKYRHRKRIADDENTRKPRTKLLFIGAIACALIIIVASTLPRITNQFVLEPAGLGGVTQSRSYDRSDSQRRQQRNEPTTSAASAGKSSAQQQPPTQPPMMFNQQAAEQQQSAPAHTGPQEQAAPAPNLDEPIPQRKDPLGQLTAAHAGINPVINTADDNLSTFSLDGDTASYDIARLYIRDYLKFPHPNTVRVEDFINAFQQGYERPTTGLDISMDAGPSPFGEPNVKMLRVGVVSPKHDPNATREPASLILVMDISGSMEGQGISIGRILLHGLVNQASNPDTVTLISYGHTANIEILRAGPQQFEQVKNKIDRLNPGGGTNLEAGIDLAYLVAQQDTDAQQRKTRIVLISDGVGNIGQTDANRILDGVSQSARQHTTLTAIGVGEENYNDVMMEALANRGNGTYHYTRYIHDTNSFIENNAPNIFNDTPRDARIQVEFNPNVVSSYRLIGYENRAVADQSFRDDTLDFGEPGFAQDVTALYEIKINADAQGFQDVATARVRWRLADNDKVAEIPRTIHLHEIKDHIRETTPEFRRTAAAAELAEMLRGSRWGECTSINAIMLILRGDPDINLKSATIDLQGQELFQTAQAMHSIGTSSLCP